MSIERLTHRVMFGTVAGEVNPGRGRPEKNWAQCLVDDLRVFEATEGYTDSSHLLFRIETTVLWPRAANTNEWELAPGDRRGGGPLHEEMAQGRGGEELATTHSRGRQEQQPRETGGPGGGVRDN